MGKCHKPLSFFPLKSAHIHLTFGHSVDLDANIHVTCFENNTKIYLSLRKLYINGKNGMKPRSVQTADALI
jgi:hypothetical protein